MRCQNYRCLMVRKIVVLFLFLLCPALCSAAIVVSEGYVREMPPGQPVSAAFLYLHNDSDQPVVLLAVSSDSAERVEMHQHSHNNGMMRMEEVASVTVPAKGTFIFEPGAYHLMLIDIKRPLREGDTVKFKFEFSNAAALEVGLPVRNIMRE